MQCRTYAVAGAALVLLCTSVPVAADSVEILSTNAAWVSDEPPREGYNTQELRAGMRGTYTDRTYIGFDTTTIPETATVSEALIHFYMEGRTVTIPDYLMVYLSADHDWVETQLYYNDQPGTTGDALDSYLVSPSTPAGRITFDVGAAAFSRNTNLSFVFRSDDEAYPGAVAHISSDEDGIENRRPYLEIEYTDDGYIPEPGTLALMGLGLAGLIARRRRRCA